jgi:probable addiction module antidote protein
MNNRKTNKTPNLVSYQLDLIERLKNRDYAIVYLNAALEDSTKGDAESQELFLRALRNVAEAQGSISELARQAHIRRESLYRMLSKKGNPELNSLVSLLHAMGFSLSVR